MGASLTIVSVVMKPSLYITAKRKTWITKLLYLAVGKKIDLAIFISSVCNYYILAILYRDYRDLPQNQIRVFVPPVVSSFLTEC